MLSRSAAGLLVLVVAVRGWTSPQNRAVHRRSASLTVRCSENLAGFVTKRFGLTEADALSLSDRVGAHELKTAADFDGLGRGALGLVDLDFAVADGRHEERVPFNEVALRALAETTSATSTQRMLFEQLKT